MSLSHLWEKIIENEEDAKKIEESFKRIDEYTKDFQVLVAVYRAIGMLTKSPQLEILLRIERNTSHLYDALTVRCSGTLMSDAS